MTINLEGKTVLLVDDEAFSRSMVSDTLRMAGQPKVIQVGGGRDALDALLGMGRVDFIISDFKMPDFDGLDLLKAVRTGEAVVDPATPFAMLTGYSDKDLVSKALSLDVNAFLLKPVSRKALIRKMMRLESIAKENGSWLKDVAIYRDVQLKDARQPSEPASEDNEESVFDRVQRSAAAAVGRELENMSAKPAPRKVRSSPAPSPDRATVDTIRDRLSGLRGRFRESDLAGHIGQGIRRMVEEHGVPVTTEVIDGFEDMQDSGTVSLDDIAQALQGGKASQAISYAAPNLEGAEEQFFEIDSIPVNSVLSRDLYARDGNLFVRNGIVLTELIILALRYLNNIKVLRLRSDDAGRLGVFVLVEKGAGVPTRMQERLVDVPERVIEPNDLSEGDVLSRGIFTSDGRLFASAGTEVGERTCALIRDLFELRHTSDSIWVVDDEETDS